MWLQSVGVVTPGSRSLRAVWVIGALAVLGCKQSQSNQPDGGGDIFTDASSDAPSDAPPPDGGDGGVPSTAVDIGIDLGHTAAIDSIESAGTRALSVDRERRWVLWDLDDATQLANATAPCLRTTAPPAPPVPCRQAAAMLRGGVAANLTKTGIELRDVNTGSIANVIPVPATNWDEVANIPDVWTWGLASDASYVWIATKSSLEVRSPEGALLVDVAGAYSTASIFAAPDELRIARGPAGDQSIERIDVATQARTTFAFAGNFHSWFLDGERFLTTLGVAVRVYSKTGSVLAFESLPTIANLAGMGDYVWTFQSSISDYPVRIYDIANLASPVQTYNLTGDSSVVASAGSLALFSRESFSIVPLGEEVVRSAPIPVPVDDLVAYSGSVDSWLVGNKSGVIFHSANLAGPPELRRALSSGFVWSIAGTESGTAALATASGRTLILNIGTVSTVTREISAMTRHLELSADATHLVAGPSQDGALDDSDRTLRVISVATGEITHSWDHASPLKLADFTFARVGLVLCHVFAGAAQPLLTDLSGTVLPYYGPTEISDVTRAHHFSPDGTKATVLTTTSPETTSIYTNGALSGVVEGRNLTWIGNDAILVAKYSGMTLESVKTYDSTGTMLSQSGLSQISGRLTYVGNGQVYMAGENAVYDIETGTKLWQGDAYVSGTVVGDYILFARGARVFIDQFR